MGKSGVAPLAQSLDVATGPATVRVIVTTSLACRGRVGEASDNDTARRASVIARAVRRIVMIIQSRSRGLRGMLSL